MSMKPPDDHWQGHAVPAMRREAWFGDRVLRAFTPRPTGLFAMFAAAVQRLPEAEALVIEQAERLSKIATQGKAVERLQLQLRREGDFARKTEITRELRAAQAALKELTEPK